MTSYCGFAIKPKSACGPNDGSGWSDRTMSVADGNDGNGALVTQRPYVYNNSFKDEWYLMPIDISETVNYEIENSQLGSYLRPEDGYTYINNALELWEYLNSYSQKWKFTSAGGGYYKISPYYNSSIAITIASGSETAENGGVIQYTYSSDNNRQKWFIYKVPHGYALKAQSAGINNLVLSVSEGNLGNGAVVSQRAYVNNLSYKEEWILHNPDLIENGVYYISMGTKYCTVTGANAGENANVAVSDLYQVSASLAQRTSQMWKIKYLGNGRYSVRPLHKLDMGLRVMSPNVNIKTIGENDTPGAVSDDAEWTIEKNGLGGYVFKLAGNAGATLSSIGTDAYPNVLVSNYISGDSVQIWTLTKVNVNNIPKGIVFYKKSDGSSINSFETYLALTEEILFEDMDLKVGVIDVSNISQSVMWYVPSVDYDYISVDNSTGDISSLKYKTTTSSVVCSRFIVNGNYTKAYTVRHSPVANGTYFMKNKKTSRYVDIDGPSMQAGTTVHQWDFNANYSQRWIFTHIGDGYYTIESANDETAYYLGVQNDGTATNTPVVLRTGVITDGMKWRVSYTDSGAFKITPKTGEANGRVLSVASYVINSNGVTIQQRDYVNDENYKDEWYIILSQGKELDTPVLYQTTDSWCWVASAQMLARTSFPTEANNGDATAIIQEQRLAVYHVFGNSSSNGYSYDWNSDNQNLTTKGGIYSDVANAAAYLTGLAGGSMTYSGSLSPYDEDLLIQFITDGYAVARLYGWGTIRQTVPIISDDLTEILSELDPQIGGHVNVIAGFTWSISNNCYYFKVIDPGNGGSIEWLTYSQLLLNVYSASDRFYVEFWYPSAVVKTSYSYQTFLEDIFSVDYSS